LKLGHKWVHPPNQFEHPHDIYSLFSPLETWVQKHWMIWFRFYSLL
jgi:hypothetical protein